MTDIGDIIIEPSERSSIIKVIGVGGGGSNAVNHMYRQGIKAVDFVICNTDEQALRQSPIPTKIQLGRELTEGLGAGSEPERGRQAAEDSINEIEELLKDNTKMVFVTAGMGGGTGTGAAPVIAQVAHEMGILTVGIVTLPFKFEARKRYNQAVEGIKELRNKVDSLLVIDNERLRGMFGNLPISQAFSRADDVLTVAAKGIAEIITGMGYINVDFADVNTIMKESGVAIMGSASASGPDRAISAIKAALNSPLLNNSDISGSKGILLNVEYGKQELTMDELSDITDYVFNEIDEDAHFIWGLATNDNLDDDINVTIVATRFSADSLPQPWEIQTEKLHLGDTENSSDTGIDKIPFDMSSDDQNDTSFVESNSSTVNIVDVAPSCIERPLESSVDASSWKMQSFYSVDTKVIDELENIPAYKRTKPSNGNSTEQKSQVSKYSVNEHGLRDQNPYLNPQKD